MRYIPRTAAAALALAFGGCGSDPVEPSVQIVMTAIAPGLSDGLLNNGTLEGREGMVPWIALEVSDRGDVTMKASVVCEGANLRPEYRVVIAFWEERTWYGGSKRVVACNYSTDLGDLACTTDVQIVDSDWEKSCRFAGDTWM